MSDERRHNEDPDLPPEDPNDYRVLKQKGKKGAKLVAFGPNHPRRRRETIKIVLPRRDEE